MKKNLSSQINDCSHIWVNFYVIAYLYNKVVVFILQNYLLWKTYSKTMGLLERIINKILLEESVSADDVSQAIDNHNRVIINYHSKGKNNNTGARVIEVYAYGLTKAGNPVIRAFQPYGDTTSRVPSWKFFRLDRITAWKPTKQQFNRPADFYYKGLGEFNPNGDETMSTVYKIAKFGDDSNKPQETPNSEPKTKADEKP